MLSAMLIRVKREAWKIMFKVRLSFTDYPMLLILESANNPSTEIENINYKADEISNQSNNDVIIYGDDQTFNENIRRISPNQTGTNNEVNSPFMSWLLFAKYISASK